jgi:hypothetical protein
MLKFNKLATTVAVSTLAISVFAASSMLSVSNKLDTHTVSAAIDKDLRENYGIVTPQSNSTTITVGSPAQARTGIYRAFTRINWRGRVDDVLRVTDGLSLLGWLNEIADKTVKNSGSQDVYFNVSNEVPMEWGEAWGYCNRYPNARLEWQGGVKTCLKR